jgi:hypothetical protein
MIWTVFRASGQRESGKMLPWTTAFTKERELDELLTESPVSFSWKALLEMVTEDPFWTGSPVSFSWKMLPEMVTEDPF